MGCLTSSLSSSTLRRRASNSCSTISLGSLSVGALTSISCPVICCTDAAKRLRKTRQLSSLFKRVKATTKVETRNRAHKLSSIAACSTNRSSMVKRSAFSCLQVTISHLYTRVDMPGRNSQPNVSLKNLTIMSKNIDHSRIELAMLFG